MTDFVLENPIRWSLRIFHNLYSSFRMSGFSAKGLKLMDTFPRAVNLFSFEGLQPLKR